jgi:hypothetical protein
MSENNLTFITAELHFPQVCSLLTLKHSDMGNNKSTGKNVASSKRQSVFETSSTYSSDLALFKSLGLKPFTSIPINVLHQIGEVKFSNSSIVKIWVCPMPALFWKFEIFVAESRKITTVSTGSGALKDFWSAVKLIAEDMLNVESTKFER